MSSSTANPPMTPRKKLRKILKLLIAFYQLSKDELDSRVHDALRNMERSDIGTIHSFAATLLRLYPLEAGVDPQFHEDDGAAFDRLFDEQWDLWLDQELSLRSPHAEDWRKILPRCRLDQIKALAKSISTENVDLRQNLDGRNAIPPTLRDWLAQLESQAATLIERHPEDRLNEKLVRAARAVLGEFINAGQRSNLLADEQRPVVREGDQSRSQGLAARRRQRSSRARPRRQRAGPVSTAN